MPNAKYLMYRMVMLAALASASGQAQKVLRYMSPTAPPVATVKVRDSGGAGNINDVQLLLNFESGLDPAGACYLSFLPSFQSGTNLLANSKGYLYQGTDEGLG